MANDVAQQLGAQFQKTYCVKLVYRAGVEVMTGSSSVYTVHATGQSMAKAPAKAVLKQQMGRGGQPGREAGVSCLISSLQHPSLVASCSTILSGGVSSFVSRPAGVSLQDMMGLPIEQRQALTQELAAGAFCALEVLHKQGIMHGDMKPANLVWDEGRRILGIIDWGCAKHFGTPVVDGNLTYMPPECFKIVRVAADGSLVYALSDPEQLSKIFGRVYDVWGAALVLLYWHVGCLPTQLLSDDYRVRSNFTQTDMDNFLREHVVADDVLTEYAMKQFFAATLRVDPDERWFAEDVVQQSYIANVVPKVRNNWVSHAADIARLETEALEVGRQIQALQLLGGEILYEDARPADCDVMVAAAAADAVQVPIMLTATAAAAAQPLEVAHSDDTAGTPSVATTSPPGTPQQLEQLTQLQLHYQQGQQWQPAPEEHHQWQWQQEQQQQPQQELQQAWQQPQFWQQRGQDSNNGNLFGSSLSPYGTVSSYGLLSGSVESSVSISQSAAAGYGVLAHDVSQTALFQNQDIALVQPGPFLGAMGEAHRMFLQQQCHWQQQEQQQWHQQSSNISRVQPGPFLCTSGPATEDLFLQQQCHWQQQHQDSTTGSSSSSSPFGTVSLFGSSSSSSLSGSPSAPGAAGADVCVRQQCQQQHQKSKSPATAYGSSLLGSSISSSLSGSPNAPGAAGTDVSVWQQCQQQHQESNTPAIGYSSSLFGSSVNSSVGVVSSAAAGHDMFNKLMEDVSQALPAQNQHTQFMQPEPNLSALGQGIFQQPHPQQQQCQQQHQESGSLSGSSLQGDSSVSICPGAAAGHDVFNRLTGGVSQACLSQIQHTPVAQPEPFWNALGEEIMLPQHQDANSNPNNDSVLVFSTSRVDTEAGRQTQQQALQQDAQQWGEDLQRLHATQQEQAPAQQQTQKQAQSDLQQLQGLQETQDDQVSAQEQEALPTEQQEMQQQTQFLQLTLQQQLQALQQLALAQEQEVQQETQQLQQQALQETQQDPSQALAHDQEVLPAEQHEMLQQQTQDLRQQAELQEAQQDQATTQQHDASETLQQQTQDLQQQEELQDTHQQEQTPSQLQGSAAQSGQHSGLAAAVSGFALEKNSRQALKAALLGVSMAAVILLRPQWGSK